MATDTATVSGTQLADDLGEYRARVELARLNQSRETIHNSSHRHAAILIEQLFLAADKHVRILCRRLNVGVYGTDPVIAAARAFLGREGARLEILVADPADILPDRHAFVREFGSRPNVTIRALDRDVDPGIDFMVVDEIAYRFEPRPEQPIARASFNRADLAGTLVAIFKTTLGPARALGVA